MNNISEHFTREKSSMVSNINIIGGRGFAGTLAGSVTDAKDSGAAGAAVGVTDEDGMLVWVELPAGAHPSEATGAAGPATGAFYASLDDAGKVTLRDTVRASLPEGPFTLPARAWLALGTVPG